MHPHVSTASPRRSNPGSPEEGLLVRCWGVRGSVAVPGPTTVRYGGNTSCVEVRCGREIVILDAGTGIRELGKALVREFDRRAGRVWLLITHTHWDHIQGFPFFAPAYLRRHRIRILGWRGSRAGLQRTVAAAVESPFFPVALPQMPGAITVEELKSFEFRLGRLRARAALINHPGGGVAFRLDTPHGVLAYVPDHEVPCPQALALARGPASRTRPGWAPGDAHDLAMRALITRADILIHDAQYTAEEYRARIGWGHSCIEAVVRLAAATGVRRLVLFHHDPDREDAEVDRMQTHARRLAAELNPQLVVDAAREGLTFRLRRS